MAGSTRAALGGAGPGVAQARIALTGDVRSAADELAHHVDRICAATGAHQVHLVGHSAGGLVARYYVQRMGAMPGYTRSSPWVRRTRAP